ncbi:hypothetical protein MMC10_002220 [Thelotrema lepadinum]|nr:hypothetical protein [Thelotrema lepadinum]
MKRNRRKVKWTKVYRKAAGKKMVIDSTLEFAKRRNVPVRYDKGLVDTTLQAMRRISEIRAKRERVFYKTRMAGKRSRELEAARALVIDNEHLLPRQRGSEKQRQMMESEKTGPIEQIVDEVTISQKPAIQQHRLRLRIDSAIEMST